MQHLKDAEAAAAVLTTKGQAYLALARAIRSDKTRIGTLVRRAHEAGYNLRIGLFDDQDPDPGFEASAGQQLAPASATPEVVAPQHEHGEQIALVIPVFNSERSTTTLEVNDWLIVLPSRYLHRERNDWFENEDELNHAISVKALSDRFSIPVEQWRWFWKQKQVPKLQADVINAVFHRISLDYWPIENQNELAWLIAAAKPMMDTTTQGKIVAEGEGKG